MLTIVTYSMVDPQTQTQKTEHYDADSVKEPKNSSFLTLLRDGVKVAQVKASEVLSIKFLTNE